MSEADLSRPWSELPMPALTLAFEKLDPRDRVGTIDSVARVCSTWAEAAAAATRTVWVQDCNTDSLQRWLCSRGGHVDYLYITCTTPGTVITTQPCPRLQVLKLSGCSIDLSAGSQLLRDLSAATSLWELLFHNVTFHGEPDLAAVLLALQCLRLTEIKVLDTIQQPDSSTASALACGVQDSHARPQRLWSAQHTTGRGHVCFADSGMQVICKLTKLRFLALHWLEDVTAAGLVELHNLRGLGFLILEGLSCDISLGAVPSFSQLTAITTLALVGKGTRAQAGFDPAFLGCLTQLQHLHLRKVNPHGAAGAAELLSRLAQLPKLESLGLEAVPGLDECRPAAFSSLTFSTVLRHLSWAAVAACRDQPGPWQHMFPGELQLHALTQLTAAKAMAWTGPDLDRLVKSCRALRELSLQCSPGLQLTALLKLRALSQLCLTGVRHSSTVSSLAQLSGLQRLRRLAITDPCSLPDDDALLPLTALTQLTYLALTSKQGAFSATMQQQLCYLQQDTFDDYGNSYPCHIISNTEPAGAPPDAWYQLLSCCEACAFVTALAALDAGVEQQQQDEAAGQEQQEEEGLGEPQQQQQHLPPGVGG